MAQLFGKEIPAEKTEYLDGKRDSPYHILNSNDNYAIVWGPFTEKKHIQVALYWSDSNDSGLQSIDSAEIKEVRGSSHPIDRSLNQLPSHVYSSLTTSFAPKLLWYEGFPQFRGHAE